MQKHAIFQAPTQVTGMTIAVNPQIEYRQVVIPANHWPDAERITFEPPIQLKAGIEYMICSDCRRAIRWQHRERHLRSSRHLRNEG